VLANLVLNAVTYSPAEAPVDIVGRYIDEWLELRVEDRGPGVPRREAERIFEPFYRGRSGAHRSRPGHGLGLAICRSTVTAHGGRIWVASRSGGGSSFIVALPVVHHHTPRRQLEHKGVPACAAQATHHCSPAPGARPLQTPT
jgi:signal transduction histidine kinase